MTDLDGDGYPAIAAKGNDCNDTNTNINPGELEICDNIDNNCDGNIDEGCVVCTDTDNDGYATEGGSCGEIDCNDLDSATNPGATEICEDGIDNNCDDVDDTCEATYYLDSDDDGYGDLNFPLDALTKPTGYVSDSTDCNDSDATINPAATEICEDGTDNNCDNVDDVCPTTYYADSDDDGYGDPTLPLNALTKPTGYVEDSTDCNDNDPSINPAATEICDDIDNNCDDTIDEGFNDLCQVEIKIFTSDIATSSERSPDTNFKNQVQTGNVEGYRVQIGEQKAFIKFDLSSVLSSMEGYEVVSASFKLTAVLNAIYFGEVVVSDTVVTQVSEIWDPTTLTHNNQPSDGTISTSQPMDSKDWNGGTVFWDVTDILTAWLSGEPNYGISVKTINLNIPLSGTFYGYSSWSPETYSPMLTVTLEPASGCTDNDEDGYATEGGECGAVDCNDSDPNIYPGAVEWCDNWGFIDSDCDGSTDNEGDCVG